ncbi:MAG: monofunctional biosynthetic peptidoglycan transglycosylase [Gammaproteobacteria bacterium]|nr:monofunctional biosynthetic peptidoglycan transglycosylase [Gammaproteobacteria bacterium]
MPARIDPDPDRSRRRRRPAPRHPWRRRLAAGLALAWLVSLAPVLLFARIEPPVTAFMLGDQIAAWRAGRDGFRLRQRWIPWEAIAPQVRIAVVAAEDQRFPVHAGFDVESIRAAIARQRDGARLRGASTISQQVAKNLFLWPGRSWLRKALEAYFTALLEALWSKRRILEVYLNVAQFGDGLYGVEAASRAYFGKPAAAINAQEAALLAAVLPNPLQLHVDRPSRYVRSRQAWILTQMRQLGGPGYLDRLE